MPTEMRIGAAARQDLAAVKAWLTAEGLPTDDLTPGHMPAFLLAVDGDDLCGMIGLEQLAEIGLLRSLVVDRESRGLGLGARLVAALEARAQSLGVVELWLLTIDADGFFLRQGFRAAARDEAPPSIQATPEFASLCPSDAVLMRKRLT